MGEEDDEAEAEMRRQQAEIAARWAALTPDELEKMRAAETSEVRGALALIAAEPPGLRAALMLVRLRGLVVAPHISREEAFTIVYGPAGAAKFWEFELGLPTMSVPHFLSLIAATRAGNSAELAELERYALPRALLLAFDADPNWFSGNRDALATAIYGRDFVRTDVRVHARQVAAWLLATPRLRYLVPASLAQFLAPPGAAPAEPVARVGRPKRAFSSAKLLIFYRKHVAHEQARGVRHNEKSDVEVAELYFGRKIPREQIRALRSEFAPENWRKGGRPKSSPK